MPEMFSCSQRNANRKWESDESDAQRNGCRSGSDLGSGCHCAAIGLGRYEGAFVLTAVTVLVLVLVGVELLESSIKALTRGVYKQKEDRAGRARILPSGIHRKGRVELVRRPLPVASALFAA